MSSPRRSPATVDLAALLPSWRLALRAERKSRQTVDSYTTGVRLFLRWCEETDKEPILDRHLINEWMAALLDAGAEPATARSRLSGLRRFSAWLLEEGEIDDDVVMRVKPPKLDSKVVQSLTEDQLRRLIKVSSGKDFRGRRDEAIVRLFAETGCRAGELIAMTVDDVDLVRGLVTVRRGKGGKGRIIPIGPQTAQAIDRYVRQHRNKHPKARTVPNLWLGDGGQGFAYQGLRAAILRRAEEAGIPNFHIHLLRHTAASRWLAAGGSEGGLMAVAGWSSRSMVDRYTRSTASARAAEEARSLALGDL